MKKGMSKFLSIVLSAAMVSPMVGMNPANAMVSSEDSADSTSATEPASAAEPASEVDDLGEVKWTKEESLEMLHEFFGYDCDQSITDANGKLIIENCIAVTISKLNNFLKEYWCPTLQDLDSKIIDKIVTFRARTCVCDPKLRFFDSLMDALLEIAYKNFEDISDPLRGFCCYMKSVVCLINATLIRSSIDVNIKDSYVDRVKSIIGIPLNIRLKLDDGVRSWSESARIESEEWEKLDRERGIIS